MNCIPFDLKMFQEPEWKRLLKKWLFKDDTIRLFYENKLTDPLKWPGLVQEQLKKVGLIEKRDRAKFRDGVTQWVKWYIDTI